ncbi:MAG: hypothetical protein WD250_03390 [Egibacteraceae bacterium]
MADEQLGGDGPRRGSGLVACGLVVAIAVLVAGGVVGWARIGAGPATRGAPGPEPVEEAVPETLAGGLELGEVPDAVAAAVDGPVVGARLVEDMPDGVGCEWLRADFDDEPDFETVLLTPDAVHVSLVGASSLFAEGEGGAGRARATCTARWQGGGWLESGGGTVPADQPMEGATGASCCDQDGLGTAEGAVMAPEGARWVLQDRGRYHLAYPVPQGRAVPITWRFRAQGGFGGGFDGGGMGSATTVTFMDDAGEVLGEATLRSF